MLGWMAYWVWWFAWRSAVTLVCMLTLQNVIHQEGYSIDTRALFIATVCAILAIRVWMPVHKQKDKDDSNHH